MSKNIAIFFKGMGITCQDGVLAGYVFTFVGIIALLIWTGFCWLFLIPRLDKYLHEHIPSIFAKFAFCILVIIWGIGIWIIYSSLANVYHGIDFNQYC